MMSLPLFPDQNRADRAVISITGETALAWLHNLLTCDVAALAEGAACYGALLSPQGKILHDLFVVNAGDRILLDCASVQRAGLVQKLTLYKLRAKLMIELDNDVEVGVHMERPEEGLVYADPRHPAMGWRSIVAAGSLINAPAHSGYDARRIELGLGDSLLDIGTDKMFPHEANFDQLAAVDFKKGCYVGQEVVSRMQHRGTARSRLLPVVLDGTHDDQQIRSDGKTIGEMLSTSGVCGLALMRIDRLADTKSALMAGSARVHVHVPGWVTYEVTVPETAK